MGSLLHPVGAQPTRVYWVRRAALLAAVVLLIVVGFALFRTPEGNNVTAVPATPSVTPTQQVTSGEPSATDSATPTPTGPLMCDQTNSGLELAGFQKVKQDGKQTFGVAVKNTGQQPCVLDLKPTNFSLTVTSGTDRIWSTDDCAKWVPAKKQTLKPQKAYEFSIAWSVKRSAPGCKLAKSQLRPGTYVAAAGFADTLKARQVFQITKAS